MNEADEEHRLTRVLIAAPDVKRSGGINGKDDSPAAASRKAASQ
jgi:hypothetical protein